MERFAVKRSVKILIWKSSPLTDVKAGCCISACNSGSGHRNDTWHKLCCPGHVEEIPPSRSINTFRKLYNHSNLAYPILILKCGHGVVQIAEAKNASLNFADRLSAPSLDSLPYQHNLARHQPVLGGHTVETQLLKNYSPQDGPLIRFERYENTVVFAGAPPLGT
jgi:hypothetical protein